MAFPTPLYVLLKGGTYLTLADVIAETREDVLNTDQTNYRDTMDAAFQGGNVQLGLNGSGGTTGILAVGLYGNGIAPPVATTLTSQTDELTHTIPRNTFSKRTMIRWWKAGGVSLIFSGDIVSPSALITVASLNGLYEGMAISGAGITAGSIIRELRTVLTPTAGLISYVVVMSQVATATTAGLAITATSPVGDLAGECWADRFIGWSSEIPGR